jgi:hypothetical protein
MTGPDHYREAERLARIATGNSYAAEAKTQAAQVALVHATLALAAATALGLPAGNSDAWVAMPDAASRAWVEAAGSAASEEADQ